MLAVSALCTGADLCSAAAPLGLQTNVVFDVYAPLARASALVPRVFSPLTAQRLGAAQAAGGLREESLVLADERFVVYVPATPPAGGYGVFVYVPPWEEGAMPKSWAQAFDATGLIFVAAANSGNEAKILDRREPLALIALENIRQRYPVDAARVYVGGFSGGSRVAERIALAWPDVFHGVLLNAGSDTLGDPTRPLPSPALFAQFQQSTRVVYLTNKGDALHVSMDLASRHSLQEWCVMDVHAENATWGGHETPDGITWRHALAQLDQHAAIDAAALAACRRRIDDALARALTEVDAALTQSRFDAAQKALFEVDARFGGLAAPRSTELQSRIDARH